MTGAEAERLAEAVRGACVKAALDAFEDASISGLCCTGAWECALGAVRSLDLDSIIAEAEADRPPSRPAP